MHCRALSSTNSGVDFGNNVVNKTAVMERIGGGMLGMQRAKIGFLLGNLCDKPEPVNLSA